MTRHATLLGLFLGCGALAACGSKDKKGDTPPAADTVPVAVVKATGAKVEISLDKAKAGDKYVLMPYILGDENVAGGKPDQNAGSFTVDAPGAKAIAAPNLLGTPRGLGARDVDHMRRSVWNRFDSRRGLDQGEDFWRTVDALDKIDATERAANALAGKALAPEAPTLRETLTDKARWQGAMDLTARPALLESGCPATIVRPSGTLEPVNIADAAVEKDDQGSFCLVYVKAAQPVTESDKAKIKKSVAEVIARYKTVYADDFAKASDFYAFKPVVVLLPIDNAGYWPQEKKFNIAGAFFREMSIPANQPMIYMATDIAKLAKPPADDAGKKLLFHSTIAHEMNHAIVDYLKSWKPLTADQDDAAGEAKRELLSYDEGLAHYCEDLMGYQEAEFSTYPGAYLALFGATGNESPFFWDAGNDSSSADMRGANHSFLYYLVSRAGGVTFKDGAPNGGKGLDFLRSWVKADAKGIANLKAAAKASGIGDDWTTVVGKYLGAVMTDGYETPTKDAEAVSQGPVGDVTTPAGDKGKTYGFRFAKAVPDLKTRLESADAANALDPAEQTLHYYHTRPILYVVGDASRKVTVAFKSAYANAAVAVVKVANGP